MRAVFRADGSATIGAGHLVRCLTLAQHLQGLGWHCAFAVNAEATGTVPGLSAFDLEVLTTPRDARPDALSDRWQAGTDWLVVDHYGLDGAWETRCRGWAQAILALDDLADRPHDCDLLLDQTLGRAAADYGGLVPDGCRVLTGSDHALLRPAFARARRDSLGRRQGGDGALRRLLVSLGATDPENHSLDVLRGIAESGLDVRVDLVLGAAAPHLERLRDEIARLPMPVQLHVESRQIPELMAAADLAIGAAGTSTWERCCLGLPSLLVVIAENQRRIAENVARTGAARRLSGPREALAGQIAAALRALAAAPAELAAMSARAAELCDGRGCDRLGLALVSPGRAGNGGRVALRLAAAEDEDIILDWQRDPETRRFARNPKVPDAEEHRRWFAERRADPDCLLTMITLDGAPAGVLRLDPRPAVDAAPASPTYEVSILVAPERRGLGIAAQALDFLRRWQGAAVIIAEVLAGNAASAELFRAAGYLPGPGGLLYSHPADPAPLPRHASRITAS